MDACLANSRLTPNSFAKILHDNRGQYRVFVRWSKGEDIDAACGQLATKTDE